VGGNDFQVSPECDLLNLVYLRDILILDKDYHRPEDYALDSSNDTGIHLRVTLVRCVLPHNAS